MASRKIVSGLVGDVITPPLGVVIGGIEFSDRAINRGNDPKGVPVLLS